MSRQPSGIESDIRPGRNHFKQALREGHRQIGSWLSSASGTTAEIAGGAGLDWLVIDGEHGSNDLRSILDQLRVLAALPVSLVVRAQWNDPMAIKPLLDIGARNLFVPFVNSPAEARSAVAAVRYPPKGISGLSMAQRTNCYGRSADYWPNADDEICLIVQIETRLVRNMEEAHSRFDEGLCFVAVGSDVGVLRAATDAIRASWCKEGA